jgi:endonuclease III
MTKDLTPADLDIDPASGSGQQLYRWFVASVLFGRPIKQSVAAETYRTLIASGLTSPAIFGDLTREALRRLLDRGGYVRLDYQMADTLHAVMRSITNDYGSVRHLITTSADAAELTERLTSLRGIGPVTARIFTAQVPESLYGTTGGDPAE